MKHRPSGFSGNGQPYIIPSASVFVATFGLLLAVSLDHAYSTIPFQHLRPVDVRLKLLTIGLGYFGVLWGYANYLLTRRSGRPLSTAWLFGVATLVGTSCLLIGGEPFKLAFYLSIMAALNAVIFCFAMRLTERSMRREIRWSVKVLLCLSPVMGLVGLLTGGLSPAGLLVPNYWIGETLQLEFLTYPYGHAVMVGICFHLFVVMCLLGLVYQSES